jgi:hypothetical protein
MAYVKIDLEPLDLSGRRAEEHIFDDTIKCLKMLNDDHADIDASFLGEKGIEDGPKREFFTVLMRALKKSNYLFDGPVGKRLLRHNTAALQVCYICINNCILQIKITFTFTLDKLLLFL